MYVNCWSQLVVFYDMQELPCSVGLLFLPPYYGYRYEQAGTVGVLFWFPGTTPGTLLFERWVMSLLTGIILKIRIWLYGVLWLVSQLLSGNVYFNLALDVQIHERNCILTIRLFSSVCRTVDDRAEGRRFESRYGRVTFFAARRTDLCFMGSWLLLVCCPAMYLLPQ